MNHIPLDDCQLETQTLDPIKERFHRIFLALVFTGILYFNVDLDRPRMTQKVVPSNPSPILIKPMAEVALSDLSAPSAKKLLNSSVHEIEKLELLRVACVTR